MFRRVPTALLACLWTVAAAAPGDGAAVADARMWLARIHAAANAGNYQGTMVFSAGGTMSSTRVGHYTVGEQTFERVEALDGQMQRVLRHNDTLQTLLPQAKVAVLERREAPGAWSATPQAVEPQALDQYDFRREGIARIAGRDAAVFLLEPRDALRYAQRLWADQESGLMLRADVIGLAAPGGARPVLESTAFSDVAIGVRPQPEAVLQELRNVHRLDGYRIVRRQQQRTSLEAQGWELKRPVAGFRLAGCVRRGQDGAGDEVPVVQAVFTDGLTHVSLFIEPFKAQRHVAEIRAQHGATGTLMQRRGSDWLTVVGDVPHATLKLFVEAIERRP